jgi:hypothetical protein
MKQAITHLGEPSNLTVVDGSPFEKGAAFEKFIANLFNKKSGRFELIDCNSNNAIIYGKAAGDLFPDLKFLFYTRYSRHKFAIECKWRERFVDGKIKWADEQQIKNYLKHRNRNNIPVFIAIGIGGLPSNPEKLFVAPLESIKSTTEVYEKDLFKHERATARKFFYDAKQLKLF